MKNIINTSNGSTTKWKEKLTKFIGEQIRINDKAISFYKHQSLKINDVGIHLAVFTEPFLSLLFEGKKTVESRFTFNKVTPFQKAKIGDIVIVKRSGGSVCGYFVISDAKYFHSPTNLQKKLIKKDYSEAIGAPSVKDFWEKRDSAKYISIFKVSFLTEISPIRIEKKDRTAWCTLKNNSASKMYVIWSN